LVKEYISTTVVKLPLQIQKAKDICSTSDKYFEMTHPVM